MAAATTLDAQRQAQRARLAFVPRRIPRGHIGHRGLGFPMAIDARPRERPRRAAPLRLAVLHPQHAGVARQVVLQCLQGGAHVIATAAARWRWGVGHDTAVADAARQQQQRPDACESPHATSSATVSVCSKPSSPLQRSFSDIVVADRRRSEMKGHIRVRGDRGMKVGGEHKRVTAAASGRVAREAADDPARHQLALVSTRKPDSIG